MTNEFMRVGTWLISVGAWGIGALIWFCAFALLPGQFLVNTADSIKKGEVFPALMNGIAGVMFTMLWIGLTLLAFGGGFGRV